MLICKMNLIFGSCLHSQCPLTQVTLKRYQIFATEGWYQMRRFDVWDDLPVTQHIAIMEQIH